MLCCFGINDVLLSVMVPETAKLDAMRLGSSAGDTKFVVFQPVLAWCHYTALHVVSDRVGGALQK